MAAEVVRDIGCEQASWSGETTLKTPQVRWHTTTEGGSISEL